MVRCSSEYLEIKLTSPRKVTSVASIADRCIRVWLHLPAATPWLLQCTTAPMSPSHRATKSYAAAAPLHCRMEVMIVGPRYCGRVRVGLAYTDNEIGRVIQAVEDKQSTRQRR